MSARDDVFLSPDVAEVSFCVRMHDVSRPEFLHSLRQANEEGGVAPAQEAACRGQVEDGDIQQRQGALGHIHVLFLDDGGHEKADLRMLHEASDRAGRRAGINPAPTRPSHQFGRAGGYPQGATR